MNQKIFDYTKKHWKKNPPAIKPGDWIKVYQRFKEGKKTRVQVFSGVVIAKKHGQGIDATFIVRKIAKGRVGVEMVFPLHSPNIIKVERMKQARTRRAKLYYLRNIKSSKIALTGEKKAPKIWEEPVSEEELEKIKQAKEKAAEAKALKKQQKQEELDKKFKQAQARRG